jgi:hypothetical protein
VTGSHDGDVVRFPILSLSSDLAGIVTHLFVKKEKKEKRRMRERGGGRRRGLFTKMKKLKEH